MVEDIESGSKGRGHAEGCCWGFFEVLTQMQVITVALNFILIVRKNLREKH